MEGFPLGLWLDRSPGVKQNCPYAIGLLILSRRDSEIMKTPFIPGRVASSAFNPGSQRIKAVVINETELVPEATTYSVQQLCNMMNKVTGDLAALKSAVINIAMRLDHLEQHISVSSTGDVHISGQGNISLSALGKLSIQAGSEIAADAQKVGFNAGKIALNAGVTTAAGKLGGATVVARDGMISPSYTPGAGNIW